jgi:CBS domain-containing protein
MPEIIHEMSAKRLGMTHVVQHKGKLLGILSDGDLRRLFERDGPQRLPPYRRRGDEPLARAPSRPSRSLPTRWR